MDDNIKKYKLENIAKISKGRGKFWKKNFDTDNSVHPALDYGSLFYNKIISEGTIMVEDSFYDENNIIPNNCVLMADSSTAKDGIGRASYFFSKDKVLAGSGIIIIEANEEFLLNKYLYYWMISNYKYINNFVTGTTVMHISSNDLLSLSLNLPSIIEQKKIIDIIKPIERKIEILNEQFDLIYKTISGYDCEGIAIDDIINWKSNGYSYKISDYDKLGKYKVFKTKDIKKWDESERTNFVKGNLAKKFDVITGLSGTIGTAKVLNEDNVVTNQRTLLMRCDYPYNVKKAIENRQKEILSHSTGSAQPNITANDILNLKLDKFFNEQKNSNLLLNNIESAIFVLQKLKEHSINILIK